MANAFQMLNSIDVSKHTEQKGRFTYLSWAFAVRELLKVVPDATWTIHEYGPDDNKKPYMSTEAGHFVKVTVHVNSVARTQVHPVLDNKNATVLEPNAFQINTSIMRCLTKAISLHGLGLYIYAGEDLPTAELSEDQVKQLMFANEELSKIDSESASYVTEKINSGAINLANYKSTVNWINKKIKDGS
jgi:hypothetical protein